MSNEKEKTIDLNGLLGPSYKFNPSGTANKQVYLGKGIETGKVGLWERQSGMDDPISFQQYGDFLLLSKDKTQNVLSSIAAAVALRMKQIALKELIMDIGIPILKIEAKKLGQLLKTGIDKFFLFYVQFPLKLVGGGIADWALTATDFINSVGTPDGRSQQAVKLPVKILGEMADPQWTPKVFTVCKYIDNIGGPALDIMELIGINAELKDVSAKIDRWKRRVAAWAEESDSFTTAWGATGIQWKDYSLGNRLKSETQLRSEMKHMEIETQRLAKMMKTLREAIQ